MRIAKPGFENSFIKLIQIWVKNAPKKCNLCTALHAQVTLAHPILPTWLLAHPKLLKKAASPKNISAYALQSCASVKCPAQFTNIITNL